MTPKRSRHAIRYALAALLVGCAGVQRECSSCSAEQLGADWVVVQMDLRGQPVRCWSLPNTSIANEQASDGIYWRAPRTGNLVHLSGLYNRVQVVGGNWDSAYAEMGLTRARCDEVHRTGGTAPTSAP